MSVIRLRPRRWLAVGITLAATITIGSHADARSGASITASFADSCRDFAAHASKDISHVVIRYADGREVKDESIESPDYAIDGGPADEIASVTVKASVTPRDVHLPPRGPSACRVARDATLRLRPLR